MASMKDYIDCVPLKIKRKVVLLKQIRHHFHCNRTLVPDETAGIPYALSKFLSQCQLEGVRNALIITGGNAMKISILRTSFTRWAKENFSTFITSYSFAKLKDGGQGAFYVIIRKKTSQNCLSPPQY